jgi:hypothetical protein
LSVACALLGTGCLNVDTPYTNVELVNDYPASASAPLVVYQAFWEAIAFSTPLPPGASSGPVTAVPASENTAYVVLAPGWDPASAAAPTSFVVLQSHGGFGVHLGDTVRIPVNDGTFDGNCAAGRALSQGQADFITRFVFPGTFAGVHYDAATCTTAPVSDAGTE